MLKTLDDGARLGVGSYQFIGNYVVVPSYDKDELARTLNVDRRHLTVEQRRELTAELRAQGMSIRGIAKATGVSKSQAEKDVNQVSTGGHLNREPTDSRPLGLRKISYVEAMALLLVGQRVKSEDGALAEVTEHSKAKGYVEVKFDSDDAERQVLVLDLIPVGDSAPVLRNIDTPTTVTGTDGKTYKTYKKSKPKKAKPCKPKYTGPSLEELAERTRATTHPVRGGRRLDSPPSTSSSSRVGLSSPAWWRSLSKSTARHECLSLLITTTSMTPPLHPVS